MKTSDILNDAADLIERRGWAQHMTLAPDGSVCAYGAIFYAARTRALAEDAVPQSADAFRAGSVLQDVIGETNIPRWNDACERTQQEVLDALRLAAKKASDG